jgi:Superinfection immunity protein
MEGAVLALGGGLWASFIVGVCLYFLPTIIAVARKVRNEGSIVVINVFLGWTLVGWVIALAMALRTRD